MNGIARWAGSEVESVLPVTISPVDDRVEVVQGFRFEVTEPQHPIVVGLPWDEADWTLCGYNRVTAKPAAQVIARHGNDPFIACWDVKLGRSAIFASDFAPHWAGSFIHWPHYSAFWRQMLHWLARR